MTPKGFARLGVAIAIVLLVVTVVQAKSWDVAWTALSAIATFAAAAIALWLPWDQEQKKRLDEDKRNRALYSDIFFEIDRALLIYREAEYLTEYPAASTDEEEYVRRVRDVEERALNSSKVLEHLLRRDDLHDGVIRRALDAIDLDTEIAKAVHLLYEYDTHAKGGTELARNEVRYDRILNGLEKHRLDVKLGARDTPHLQPPDAQGNLQAGVSDPAGMPVVDGAI